MSITNFSTVFQGKSQDEIYSIISQIFQKTFTLSNPGILLLLVGFGIWCIWKSACKHPTKVLKEILFLIMASYLVYQIGMLAMYLFSMPGEEAMSLAGYSRYHKTILTFITGLILAETLLVSQELTARYQHQLFSISLSVLVLLVLFQATEPNLSYLHKQTLAGTEREKFDYLVEGYGVLPKSRYAVIVSNIRHDFGYLDHLIAYSLNPQSYTILQDTNLKDTNWSEYDYIIVYEETENARAYLSEHFPETTEPVVYLNLYHH